MTESNPVDQRLRGAVAIITGAGVGIGRAIAVRLAAHGVAAAVAVQSTLAPPDVRGSMLAAISSSSAGLDVPPATLAAMATGLMFL